MKINLFKTLMCLAILILTSCNTNGTKNNQNVGYNVPKLDSFEITVKLGYCEAYSLIMPKLLSVELSFTIITSKFSMPKV